MVRKQIYIAPQQQKMLNKLTRKSGKSEAQIIRDILDEYQRLQERRAAWEQVLATVDLRAQQAHAKTNASRTWKREDLYDRHERPAGHKRSRVSV